MVPSSRSFTSADYEGTRAFGALLPAYLAFLVERDGFSDALYVVANQLTRKDDAVSQRTFDARLGELGPAQRAVVTDVVAQLAERPAMQRAMTPVRDAWPFAAEDRLQKCKDLRSLSY